MAIKKYIFITLIILTSLSVICTGCGGGGGSTGGSSSSTSAGISNAATISGVVYDDKGEALDGARVILTPLARASQKDGAAQECITQNGGQYTFTVQYGGSYRIEAWLGETLLGSQQFTVAAGESLTINFGQPVDTASLTVYVWQDEAQTIPVTGFTAKLILADSSKNAAKAAKTYREGGSVTFENLPAGDYVLTVTYEEIEEVKKVLLTTGDTTENIVLYRWKQAVVENITLFNLYFSDSLHGWAVGDGTGPAGVRGTIIKTTDGGKTWSAPQYINGTRVLYSVYFIDNQTGWAAGHEIGSPNHGVIIKTTDGGTSWSHQVVPGGIESLGSIYFTDSQIGWAVGMTGTGAIIKTTDGGLTWNAPKIFAGIGTFSSVYFIDQHTGWAGGPGGIVKTTDAGAAWSDVKPVFCYRLYFTDSLHGWSAASAGGPLRTVDGGETWEPPFTTLPDTNQIRGVYFTDNMNGWAAGDESLYLIGRIGRTRDGGKTWSNPVLCRDPMNAIQFVGENRGWAAGYGTIMRYAPLSD